MTGLDGHIYDFLVEYKNSIAVNDILDVPRYLMKSTI